MAVSQILDLLIAEHVAELAYRPVENAVEVHDSAQLEALLGASVAVLTDEHSSFWLDSDLILAPPASLVVAEQTCRRFPQPGAGNGVKGRGRGRRKGQARRYA